MPDRRAAPPSCCDELVERRARPSRPRPRAPRSRPRCGRRPRSRGRRASGAGPCWPPCAQSDHAHLHLRPPGRVVVGPGPAAGCYPAAVSTSGSPADTTSVCSACADGDAVRREDRPAVVPGADVVRARPRIGSIVMTVPSPNGWSNAGTKTLGTVGSSWIERPMPCPVSSPRTAQPRRLGLGLDGGADRVHRRAGPRGLQPLAQRRLRGGGHPRHARRDLPTGTEIAASAKKPSSSAVTSSLTSSPARRRRGPGIPWTASSSTLMQIVPGNPYTSAGRGAGAVAREDPRGVGVELGGGHARAHPPRDLAQGGRDDAPGAAQTGELLGGVDRHGATVTPPAPGPWSCGWRSAHALAGSPRARAAWSAGGGGTGLGASDRSRRGFAAHIAADPDLDPAVKTQPAHAHRSARAPARPPPPRRAVRPRRDPAPAGAGRQPQRPLRPPRRRWCRTPSAGA